MRDLSVLIPARNEIFLQKTVDNILESIEADTEIVVVFDGYRPETPLNEHPRLMRIYEENPIGQRGATNRAAKYSLAKFVMKLDAHCAVDKGFDVKLMSQCEKDWTVIPRMYNLHVFDWECIQCGQRYYQADPVEECSCKCKVFKQTMVWKPRIARRNDFARFDSDLHFQYWKGYKARPEAQGEIADTMSSIGACFFMHRERYLELEGLDEKHGFWGQVGTEVACKAWLSGGRQVVNKKTWFGHYFRVGKLKFPYPIEWQQQENARIYSRWLWFGGHWPKAKLPLKWIVDKFGPVPGWENFDWSNANGKKSLP